VREKLLELRIVVIVCICQSGKVKTVFTPRLRADTGMSGQVMARVARTSGARRRLAAVKYRGKAHLQSGDVTEDMHR